MGKVHRYEVHLRWTGDRGVGTADYHAYGRDHVISRPGKPDLHGSSDPAFRGDPARWTPEELLLASLSACHQLWYLHLCAEAGVTVVGYEDAAAGTMAERADGAGQFTDVVLHPAVTLAPGGDIALAARLHEAAAAKCFIARSVNFPVRHAPVLRHAPTGTAGVR